LAGRLQLGPLDFCRSSCHGRLSTHSVTDCTGLQNAVGQPLNCRPLSAGISCQTAPRESGRAVCSPWSDPQASGRSTRLETRWRQSTKCDHPGMHRFVERDAKPGDSGWWMRIRHALFICDFDVLGAASIAPSKGRGPVITPPTCGTSGRCAVVRPSTQRTRATR
jgi:hypothetical protein